MKAIQKQIQPPKPLENSDYEFLFMQLLEGIAHGWQQSKVEKFFAELDDRTTEAQWVQWIRGFGERLLASPAPNQELALRMLALGDMGYGEISDTAGEIGLQLLQRQEKPIIQTPQNPAASNLFLSVDEAGNFDEQPQTISLEQLWELLQQDPELVQQMAALLQINTDNPEEIIRVLMNQSIGASMDEI
ncbi:hypothetical protein IQ264_31840 [Phormidium sp. LEGE 05292]|uniref:hypothetical protein n=1 Tax=[Phormidium] sp. LEGE 05292 TaxID=767427 RepID=UPI00188021CE|nr:hypothetical protein [Phormidium sp. LEGE 05292]MBE9229994.1 hypothetical protein [Phormidium sp. LEGE 05292]